MVAKKGKTPKKLRDLSVKKVTSAQAKRIKGGGNTITGRKKIAFTS